MMNQSIPRILLTGFMGAGKTTIAAALAQRLNCHMLDLDRFIAEREGRSVQAIIDEEGEAQFREVETRALHDALKMDDSPIIALGGGAWTIERNRALIAQHQGYTVWLDAPFELCWQRINSVINVRPLARDREKAQQLYERRRALYQLAPLRVEVSARKNVGAVVTEIGAALTR